MHALSSEPSASARGAEPSGANHAAAWVRVRVGAGFRVRAGVGVGVRVRVGRVAVEEAHPGSNESHRAAAVGTQQLEHLVRDGVIG